MGFKSQPFIDQSNAGEFKIGIRLWQKAVWLSQGQMSNLFWKDKRTISEHIQNVFIEGELERNPTVRNFRTVLRDSIDDRHEYIPKPHLQYPQIQQQGWN